MARHREANRKKASVGSERRGHRKRKPSEATDVVMLSADPPIWLARGGTFDSFRGLAGISLRCGPLPAEALADPAARTVALQRMLGLTVDWLGLEHEPEFVVDLQLEGLASQCTFAEPVTPEVNWYDPMQSYRFCTYGEAFAFRPEVWNARRAGLPRRHG